MLGRPPLRSCDPRHDVAYRRKMGVCVEFVSRFGAQRACWPQPGARAGDTRRASRRQGAAQPLELPGVAAWPPFRGLVVGPARRIRQLKSRDGSGASDSAGARAPIAPRARHHSSRCPEHPSRSSGRPNSDALPRAPVGRTVARARPPEAFGPCSARIRRNQALD